MNNDGKITSTVVIATYNGSKFIVEQLESIYNQTVPPDQVIIRDDCSKDGTQHIVQDFIQGHCCDNWSFLENSFNKGFTKNFIDAAREATSDVIFFCDQDDKWMPGRVEHTIKTYSENPGALAVVCGVSTIDDASNPKKTLADHFIRRGKSARKISFTEQVSTMLSAGHSLSVRRTFMEEIIPLIESEELTFDSPIGLLAAANGGFYQSGTVDVCHRVHQGNASAPRYESARSALRYEQQLHGREYQLRILMACTKAIMNVIGDTDRVAFEHELSAREESIEALRNKDRKSLVKLALRSSKMKNPVVDLMNILVTVVD